MKIFLLLVLLETGIICKCSAQTTRQTGKFGISVDAAFPLSDYDSYYKMNLFKYGMGGSLKFDIPTFSNLFVTLSGGIITFYASGEASKRIDEVTLGAGAKSEDYAPFKAGLKYYFARRFYGEVQIGAVLHTGPSVAYFGDNFLSRAYSSGVGYSFNSGFELDAHYELWNTKAGIDKLSQLGIRVAYSFKLR
jgi:hypothetical protein